MHFFSGWRRGATGGRGYLPPDVWETGSSGQWTRVLTSVFLAGYQKQVAPAYYQLSKQVSPAFGSQLKKHWY
jgi:hypothetical protein